MASALGIITRIIITITVITITTSITIDSIIIINNNTSFVRSRFGQSTFPAFPVEPHSSGDSYPISAAMQDGPSSPTEEPIPSDYGPAPEGAAPSEAPTEVPSPAAEAPSPTLFQSFSPVGGLRTNCLGNEGDLKEVAITVGVPGLPAMFEHDVSFNMKFKVQIRSTKEPPADGDSVEDTVGMELLDTACRSAAVDCVKASKRLGIEGWRTAKTMDGDASAGPMTRDEARARALADPKNWPGAINVPDSVPPAEAEEAPAKPAEAKGAGKQLRKVLPVGLQQRAEPGAVERTSSPSAAAAAGETQLAEPERAASSSAQDQGRRPSFPGPPRPPPGPPPGVAKSQDAGRIPNLADKLVDTACDFSDGWAQKPSDFSDASVLLAPTGRVAEAGGPAEAKAVGPAEAEVVASSSLEEVPEHLSPVQEPPSAIPNAIGSPLPDLISEGSGRSLLWGPSIAKTIGQRIAASLEHARRNALPRDWGDPIAFGFARADSATVAAHDPFSRLPPARLRQLEPPLRPKRPSSVPLTDRFSPKAQSPWIETKRPRFLEPKNPPKNPPSLPQPWPKYGPGGPPVAVPKGPAVAHTEGPL